MINDMKENSTGSSPSQSPVLIEGGIAKFPAGRLPDEAEAVADEAWRLHPTDAVIVVRPEMGLDEVNSLALAPGATVLFERGGVWRGQLLARSGTPDHPIRYGACGTGPEPVIQPSLDASDAAAWRREEDAAGDLWSFFTGSPVDSGNVILDHGESGCLFKRGSLAETSRDRDFFFDPASCRVFVRSSGGNPAGRWSSIEIAQKLNAVDEPRVHDVVYENLRVRYGAAHGFGGGGTARITIRDCDVEWIGGGYLYRDDAGNGVRYGNGIEFWGGAEDILVERCRVCQCWDAGITNQTNEPGSVQRNISWRDCEVSRCEYSYEFWHQGAGGRTENVVLAGNRFRDAGGGWGHAQRWNPNAAHLMLYDTVMPTPGFVVRDNVFARSEDVLARIFNEGWGREATFRANTWISGGEPYLRCHRRPRAGLVYLYPDRLDRIHDDNAAEIESQGAGGVVCGVDDASLLERLAEEFGLREDEFSRRPRT